jgi:hypothetical protein
MTNESLVAESLATFLKTNAIEPNHVWPTLAGTREYSNILSRFTDTNCPASTAL